jgi:ribosome-associated protein
MEIKLEGEEFILLQSLLQVSGLCDTGGEAKHAITEGKVKVDGETEIRRGKKIRAGQVISFKGKTIQVVA